MDSRSLIVSKKSVQKGSSKRREGQPRKRLPAHLEAFARSDDKKLRPKKRRVTRPRLKDPRSAGVLVPGVANRDARTVYQRRVEKLLSSEGSERAQRMAEAVLLQVWRGHSITTFEAFVEDVLGLELDVARAFAEEGAAALGVELVPQNDEVVALWMRAECALGDTEGAITLRGNRLHIEIDVDRGVDGLVSIGKRLHPLAQDRKSNH